MLRDIQARRVQCDDSRGEPGVGSMQTWTVMDAETKLIISWQLGARNAANSHRFMADVSERLASDPHASGRSRAGQPQVDHRGYGRPDRYPMFRQKVS